jgi:hypothetical protein
MVNEINVKVGKTYPIKYVIEELKKHPDIRIGHILALNRHQYHLGVDELEALRDDINKAEKTGEVLVYDISGKKRIDASDIAVLSIIDPYSKYMKYERFYNDLYKQIVDAIDGSTTGVIMTAPKDLLEEARKEGFGVEKESDLLDGIYIFFSRRGIEGRPITKDKDGTKKEYIVFAREGVIEKEDQSDKPDRSDRKVDKKEKGKGQAISMTEHEAKELKEKTKEFENFYIELEKDIITFISQRKDKEGAVSIESIMLEAKKVLPNIENRQDVFLRGMILYFGGKGINVEILKEKNFVIFKMV